MKSERTSPFLRFLTAARPHGRRVVAAVACMVLAAAFGTVPPWLLKNVVDDVLISKNTGMLNLLSVALVLLYTGKALFSYGQRVLMTEVGQRIVVELRLQLYDHIQRMSLAFLSGRRVGELVSRITNDVNVLQDIVGTVVTDLVVQGVTLVGMLGFLVYINWRLTLLACAVLPLAAWLIARTSRTLRRIGHDIQEEMAHLAAAAQEALSALRIVRSFATEEEELERFRERNEANFSATMRGVRMLALLEGAVEVILVAALALLLWLGGRDVIEGRLSPGELIAFLGYLGFMVQPIRSLSRVVSRLQQGLASTERVFDLLDTPRGVEPPKNPVRLDAVRGGISFENVSFSYEKGRDVFRGLDLHITPGEVVAVVGATGAGKSTLADLILRFHDPQEGCVRVDGHDVRTLDPFALRRRIGVVPQDPVLLKGSIAFNIAYGCPGADLPRIEDAARVAGVHDFIASLPRGYETEVGERGVTLSGGQRQRVALARALVRDPRILLLDEATSALDAEVETQIQEAMQKAMRGRTAIVIAHRLSTIRTADRIVVLEGGRVAEEGTHASLLAEGGVYARLHALQYGVTAQGRRGRASILPVSASSPLSGEDPAGKKE